MHRQRQTLLAIITTLRFWSSKRSGHRFSGVSKYSPWEIFCADPTCVEALAPICVLHHQQFAGSNSLWIKLPARSAGFDLTVAYFSTSDRKSSCPALLRAIQCGLDFVQTNFCAQIFLRSELFRVVHCSSEYTTHLEIETLHSCVAGIVLRFTPCG